MFALICRRAPKRLLAKGAGLAAIGMSVLALAPAGAAAQDHEITVSITKFHALDKADDLSRGDFFARVTIDGQPQATPTISDQAEVSPDWKISKSVAPGLHNVKLELIDKDLSVDDPIDVNRLDKKRD